MGKFRELTVENIRCFGVSEQALDLTNPSGEPAQWNVLLGNNGTGKTTLLQALAFFSRTNAPPPEQALWGGPMGMFPAMLSGHIPLGLRLKETEPALLHSYRSIHSDSERNDAPADDYRIAASITNCSADRKLPRESRTSEYSIARSGHSTAAGKNAVLPICFGYGAWRSPAQMRQLGRTEISNLGASVLHLFQEYGPLVHAENFIRELDYIASKDSEVKGAQREHYRRITSLLIDVLPDVSEVTVTVPTQEHPSPTVLFTTLDGPIPFRGLGHGYRTAVGWMVDLVARLVAQFPASLNPLEEEFVVLVDEIDLHLHPRWQRSLMDHLSARFPNAQFIVTAHSPLFVQAAEDANIVVLRRDEEQGHVVIDNDVEVVKGWRVDQLLTSDLFGLPSARPPRMDQLLQDRRKLLSKSRLTKEDKEELQRLEDKIGSLPAGETAADSKTMEQLERTLDVLQRKVKKSGDTNN